MVRRGRKRVIVVEPTPLEKVAKDLEQSARTFRYMDYFFIVAGTVTILRWIGRKYLELDMP